LGGVTIAKAIGILLFGSALLYWHKLLVLPDCSVFALIIICAWTAASSALNADSDNELFEALMPISSLIQCVVFYYVVQAIFRDQRTAFNTLLVFSISSVVVSILMIRGIGAQESGTEKGLVRFTFFGMHPNSLALFLAIGIVIIAGIVIENPRSFGLWRYLLLLCVPILLKAAFMAGSRGALVSLVLGIIPFLFTRKSAWIRILVWFQLVGFAVLIMIFALNSDILMLRMEKTISTGDSAGREDLWRFAVEKIAENPILGLGFTGMTRCINEVSDVSDPHNGFLAIFMLTGFFGGTLFLSVTVWWLKIALRARKTVWGYLPLALFVVVVSAFVKSGGIYLFKIVWLMFAFIGSMRALTSTNKSGLAAFDSLDQTDRR
jgi:O-antigen ligase